MTKRSPEDTIGSIRGGSSAVCILTHTNSMGAGHTFRFGGVSVLTALICGGSCCWGFWGQYVHCGVQLLFEQAEASFVFPLGLTGAHLYSWDL